MKKDRKRKELERLIKEGQQDERESLIWYESGRTVRSVDFQRVENNPHDSMPLTPYELEVKEELASAPSPFDELARAEEEQESEKKEHALKTKLALLVQRARFSPQQRTCYELFYEKQLSANEVGKRMEISRSHFCHLKQQIQDELIRAREDSLKPSYRKRKNGVSPLTERQRRILQFRKQGLTLAQIAKKLGVSSVRVHQIIREGVEKFL